MRRTGSSKEARILLAGMFETLAQEFDRGRVSIFSLRNPEYATSYLFYRALNGDYYSLDLIYGSMDSEQHHIRVTTWHNVPGQDFEPRTPFDAASMTPEYRDGHVAGQTVRAAAYRQANAWRLDLSIDGVHIRVSGRGPHGDLTLEPLRDIAPVLEATKAWLQKDFRD